MIRRIPAVCITRAAKCGRVAGAAAEGVGIAYIRASEVDLLILEEVVALAFNPVPPNAFFTVTWSHGNKGGSLVAGKSVPIQNGMKFDATETGQS